MPARPRGRRARSLAAAAAAAVLVVAAVGCAARVAAAAPAPPAASAKRSLVDRCIEDGRASDPACADAVYPSERVEEDVESLCRSMPDMSGCSLRRMCLGGGGGSAATGAAASPSSSSSSPAPDYCHPFALLAALCEEMPTMRGCGAYVALCMDSSSSSTPPPQKTAQCAQHPPPPKLVGSTDARRLVRDACADMPMAGCAICAPTGGPAACPDPLRALASVCLEMGGMRQCGAFDAMCAASSSSASSSSSGSSPIMRSLCGGQPNALPPMTMWFHQRIPEVLLWRGWVPRTPAEYAGAIVALLSFGVASVALKTARGRYEAQWIHDSLCSRSPARRAAAAAEAEAAAAAEAAQAAAAGWRGAAAGGGGKAAAAAAAEEDGRGSSSSGALCCQAAAPAPPSLSLSPARRNAHRPRRSRLVPHPRVATCCERHAALGPRTPLQRLTNTLAFANCVRAFLVGAAAVFDYFNMLAVMTFNAGFFAAVVCGYALGTLLLSHLVVPAPAPAGGGRGGGPWAGGNGGDGGVGGGAATSGKARRRRALRWGSKKDKAAAAAAAGVTAAGGAGAGAAGASGACCGGGGDVEAAGTRTTSEEDALEEHLDSVSGAVAGHLATSAARESCC